MHGWKELAAEPPADLDAWALRNLDSLTESESTWLTAADGKTLLHGDINASNLLVADTTVLLVDWGQPASGAAWIDVADLIPHLILANHTPAAAEQAITGALSATGVHPDVVTSYAIAFA